MAAEKPMSVEEFCEFYGISRSTYYDWKAKGRAPKSHRLPNGELRMKRVDVERWFEGL